jgi:hypothetical protein
MNKKLKEYLEKEGYKSLVYIEGKGICGLMGFMYTVGLVAGLDKDGYSDRYCYPHSHAAFAVLALSKWAMADKPVEGDPDDPYWIKRKGSEEYINPLYSEHASH